MNKKMIKIMGILALTLLVVFTFSIPAFATKDFSNFDDMNVKNIKGYDTSGASNSVGRIASAILNIVQVVAIATAIIMLIVLAIKYISSAPNDKAEIKKHAVVYVVGAVLLFSASGILEIIKNFAKNINAG